MATWCEELTHWKRPWCWERLKAGGEGDEGWDGWMASLTQWIWVWASSGSWWWTGKPGVLQQSMGSQSHTWLSTWTELNMHNAILYIFIFVLFNKLYTILCLICFNNLQTFTYLINNIESESPSYYCAILQRWSWSAIWEIFRYLLFFFLNV